jgi:hypothetical protein
MLSVTDRALDALEGALEANRTADDQMLRIDEMDGSMAVAIDQPQPSDQLIMRDENPVLAVAHDAAARLDGLTLDILEDERELHLVFR